MQKLKLLLFCGGLLSTIQITYAQTNTLPSSGNVGIGTTSPSATLDVNGSVSIDSVVIISDSVTMKDRLTVEQDLKVKGKVIVVDNAKFKKNVKVLGNFKIKSLEDSNINYNRLLTITPTGKIKVKDLGLGLPTLPDPNCGNVLPWSLYLNTKNINHPKLFTYLCEAYDGLGIGTNEPNYKLEVVGTSYFNGSLGIGTTSFNSRLNVNSGQSDGMEITTEHINDYGYGVKSTVNRDLTKAYSVYNKAASEESFIVYGNGNVYATKIYISETPFPDYVFEPDYDLMSLTELETYIKSNNKLPNMPSQEEVEENGADIAEINRLLVEKVEELTLYIIEQEKRIKLLESKIIE